MQVSAHDVIERLHAAAAAARDDATSNVISKLANRLAHQGSLFERPLSEAEQILIAKYAGLRQ